MMDPAPRKYSSNLTLWARSARGRAAAPAVQHVSDVEDWLLCDAIKITGMLPLFEEFVWRCVAAGLPLDRASLHLGTLHPLLAGFAWNWNIVDGLCDEVQVVDGALQKDMFLKSPLAVVLRSGQELRLDLTQPGAVEQFAIATDLLALGITEYAALPLGGSGRHNVATIATRRAGGFTVEQFGTINRLVHLLSLHAERHIAARIAENVMTTYLGPDAGAQVLQGSIKRGEGRQIDAVIWISDLRGFTDLSDRLAPKDMLAVLNAYFSVMAGTVTDHGGEVLKFIGDGLLAVFPLDRDFGGRGAANVAVAAAKAALNAELALNLSPPSPLDDILGWRPLRSGIGLHVGGVFFGNIGSAARLDFTVIGQAVNTASRIEGLTKALNAPLLMSAEVAQGLSVPPVSLGTHALRGVGAPVAVFAPR